MATNVNIISTLTKLTITEKETGLRNFLVVKGFRVSIQLLAWSILLWAITSFSSVITAIIFKIRWSGGSPIVPESSFSFLLFFLIAYCLANSTFCMMVSSICSTMNKAVPFLTLCWILSFIMFLHSAHTNPFTKFFGFQIFFMPNSLAANALKFMFWKENFSEGMNFIKLFSTKRIGVTHGTLIFSAVLFFFMACLLDQLNPGLYGKPFNPLKLFRMKKKETDRAPRIRSSTTVGNYDHKKKSKFASFSTPVAAVTNLTKSFGDNRVFENFSFSLYNNEILVCLGSNNSGKTVLSLILGGLLPFDSGSIIVKEIDLEEHRKEALNKVAIAPGTSLLMSDLTFQEQLVFFARINGVTVYNSWKLAQELTIDLNMGRYSGVKTKQLPQTIQKTLAIMCAFSSEKSIIILDSLDSVMEGVRGMNLLDFVFRKKEHHSIFITTSSLNLANILSNHVLFLFKGTNNNSDSFEELTTMLNQNIILSTPRTTRLNVELLSKRIQDAIPQAKLFSNERSYELEFKIMRNDTDKIAKLLQELEENWNELQYDNIHIRQETVHDVFRAVILKKEKENLTDLSIISQNETFSIISRSLPDTTYMKKLWLRIQVVLYKHYYLVIVNKLAFIGYLLLPIILCTFGMILLKISAKQILPSPRKIAVELYSRGTCIVSSSKRLQSNRRDIILAYRKYWLSLDQSIFFYNDLLKQNFIDFLDEPTQFLTKKSDLLVGMAVTRHSIIAKFSPNHMHTAQTSLALVHNAILRSILSDFNAEIEIMLSPLPAEFNVIEHDINLMKFLAFCLILSFWFLFGLPDSGLFSNRHSYHSEQQREANIGTAFWLAYILVILIKLAIIIPLTIGFLFISEYRVFMTSRLVGIIIAMMTLSAFYFQFVKFIISTLFYQIEKKYMITIFLTIVSIISYNFQMINYTNYTDINMNLVFLPLNILSQFLFYAIYIESVSKICKIKSIYDISVNIEKCKLIPNCCQAGNFKEYEKKFFLFVFSILIAICLAVVLSILCRMYRVYSSVLLFRARKKFKYISEKLVVSQGDADVSKDEASDRKLHASGSLNKLGESPPVTLIKVGVRNEEKIRLKNLSLSLKRGDCLCLICDKLEDRRLLFDLISGYSCPTEGEIYVYGTNPIPKFYKKNKVHIGYCMRQLERISFLTVGSYMELYAMSVGITRKEAKKLCPILARQMNIISEYKKLIKYISSTTRVRMRYILTFLGDPQLLLFDITISELDFCSHDIIMDILGSYLAMGGAAILATLSASKGALFGNTFGIVANSELKFYNNIRDLIKELAHGYFLLAKVGTYKVTTTGLLFGDKKSNEHAYVLYSSHVESHFPNAIQKERIDQYIYYFIPFETSSFAEIFTFIINNQEQLKIMEYCITENTTELVNIKDLNK